MNKVIGPIILMLFLGINVCFAQGSDDSITITTYYPSPYGVYRTLRLFPSGRPGSCQEGEVFYDDGFYNGEIKQAYSLFIELYQHDFKGLMGKFGLGHWESSVGHKNVSEITTYKNVYLTAGIGYAWSFLKIFYTNLLIEIYGPVMGDTELSVGSYPMILKEVVPGASLTFGIQIPLTKR